MPVKALFLEALGILMENREEIIGDCRAVMEALADCSSINTEMHPNVNLGANFNDSILISYSLQCNDDVV